jgi:hypothetical protein
MCHKLGGRDKSPTNRPGMMVPSLTFGAWVQEVLEKVGLKGRSRSQERLGAVSAKDLLFSRRQQPAGIMCGGRLVMKRVSQASIKLDQRKTLKAEHGRTWTAHLALLKKTRRGYWWIRS